MSALANETGEYRFIAAYKDHEELAVSEWGAHVLVETSPTWSLHPHMSVLVHEVLTGRGPVVLEADDLLYVSFAVIDGSPEALALTEEFGSWLTSLLGGTALQSCEVVHCDPTASLSPPSDAPRLRLVGDA